MFKNWGWDDMWAALLYVTVACGLLIGVTALVQDHRIMYYSINQPDDSKVATFCVEAERNWEWNTRVGCFTDEKLALDTLVTLNDQLKRK